MEASNVQKNVKPHIVLIDGVKYYSDKPETCRSCFFWKNRKVPCILGQENCYYLAEIIQSEQQKKCEGCCYASGRSCVSATCYKDLMTQFNASKNTKPKETSQYGRTAGSVSPAHWLVSPRIWRSVSDTFFRIASLSVNSELSG